MASSYWKGWMPHRVAVRVVFGKRGSAHVRSFVNRVRGRRTYRASRGDRPHTETLWEALKPQPAKKKTTVPKRPAAPRPPKPPRPPAPRTRSSQRPAERRHQNCPWCRGAPWRPLWKAGQHGRKYITGVVRCNGEPVPKRGLPAQPPLAQGDVLICTACGNETAKQRRKAGLGMCPTCRGWAEKHDLAHR